MTIDWNRISTAPLPANCGWKGTYRVRYSEIGDNGKGEIIGVAQSFWVMFDLCTRRAAQWPDWVTERLPDPPGPKLIAPPLRPAFTPDPLPTMDNIKARPSDLDLYGHVNNVRLMQWVMGVAGPDGQPDFHPESLDIQFRSECRVQERVAIRHADGFAAITREEDGTDLVRAHIVPFNQIAVA